jgi:hypothetical protein
MKGGPLPTLKGNNSSKMFISTLLEIHVEKPLRNLRR